MKNKRYTVRFVMKDGVNGETIFTTKSKAYPYYNSLAENKKCVRVFIVEETIIEGHFESQTKTDANSIRWN